ncbi:MAG: hypothetical protein MHMPM18_003336 [Marteilia pararefringens]
MVEPRRRCLFLLQAVTILASFNAATGNISDVKDYIHKGCEPYDLNLSWQIDLERDSDDLAALPDDKTEACINAWTRASRFYFIFFLSLGIAALVLICCGCCLCICCCFK